MPNGRNVARRQGRKKVSENGNQSIRLEEGVLFKKGYLVPMLRCVGPLQADYVIREIHMGSCRMLIWARSVVAKAIRQGYYCPTMHKDARNVTQNKAVIPVEIGMPSHRTMMIREDENEDELRLNMDLLQEKREEAAIREARYKTKMEQYYNKIVRATSFKPDE
ncbi:hypothetical protein Tco_1382743 [Tanacetum coccineum]